MPKHHILCVHGIGKHSNKWVEDKNEGETSFKELFEKNWDAYPALKGKGSFKDYIHLESIHYDDEINKLFESWEKEANKLKTHLGDLAKAQEDFGWVTDCMDKAAEAKADENYLYTNLMDLVLFWCSPTIQNHLVQYTGEQIVKYVNKITSNAEASDEAISIIAHSMGTSMVHKTMQAMFNQKLDGETLSGHFKFHLITQASNVSYVLSGDRKNHYNATTGPSETIVRPSLYPRKGVCRKMINVNHEYDLAAQFLPFNPPLSTWLDTLKNSSNNYADITLQSISGVNVHDINHYFRDPKLQAQFFEMLTGDTIPQSEKEKAAEQFAQTTPEGSYKKVRTEFKKLIETKGKNNKDFYASLKNFYALIKLFKVQIGDLK